MVIIDAVVRLLPGALGDERSAEADIQRRSKWQFDFAHRGRPGISAIYKA